MLMAVQDVKPELQPISQLWRFRLDPWTSSMLAQPLAQRGMEYPAVNPQLSGEQLCYWCLLSLLTSSVSIDFHRDLLTSIVCTEVHRSH